jgi:hypothetical protein
LKTIHQGILGGSATALASAVIWIYTHFVTVAQYDKDQLNQQRENDKLWHAIHETNPQAK